MNTKKPWQSRTILINAVLGICGAVALFVPAASGISTFITSNAATIAMVWSLLNIVLRAVTKDQIVLVD